MENFINGFTSWQETHFLIVEHIVLEKGKATINGKIKETLETQGTCGLWKLALDWTNEFEKSHHLDDWEELDYYETVEEFCQTKNKN